MFATKFIRNRILIYLVIGLIVLGLGGNTTPDRTYAAEGVIIQSQAVFCNRIDVSYEVVVAFPNDTATLRTFAGGSQLASVSGTGTPSGIYTVSIPINPPQPIGTVLHAEVEINNGNGYIVTDVGSPTPCYENSDGGEIPPPSSTWDGYTDGRLNPDMAEYYTVYCRDDFADVYRSSPSPTTKIAEIAISDMTNLSPSGGSFIQDGINVQRFDDEITLSGTNGNLVPDFGSKSFRLSACIERNGGEPDILEPPTVPPQEPADNDSAIPILELWMMWLLTLLSEICGANLLPFGLIVAGIPILSKVTKSDK